MMLLSVVPVGARRGRLPVRVFSESLEQLGEVQGRIGALGRVVQLPARLTIREFPKMQLHPGRLAPREARLASSRASRPTLFGVPAWRPPRFS